MGDDSQPDERGRLKGAISVPESASPAGAGRAGTSLERRFRLALALYAVLGLLVWFTMGEGKILVHGRLVEMRLVPLIVIGGLAFRTVVARQAEKIRRQDGEVSGNSSL
jgi:hypothetical protein